MRSGSSKTFSRVLLPYTASKICEVHLSAILVGLVAHRHNCIINCGRITQPYNLEIKFAPPMDLRNISTT